MRKLVLTLPLIALLFFTAQASLTITPINTGNGNGFVSYLGQYWGYPSPLGSEFEVSSSYFSCSGSFDGDPYSIFWNLGAGTTYDNYVYYPESPNPIVFDAGSGGGYYTYNYCGQTEMTIPQLESAYCWTGSTEPPGASVCPQLGFATDGSGNNYLYHTYSSTGMYVVEVVDPYTSASQILYLFSSPSLGGPYESVSSMDLGSTAVITGSANCGSNTECPDISLTGLSDFGSVASPYSLSYNFDPVSSGTNTIQLCAYNPISSSSICNSGSIHVFTDLQNPSLTYSSSQYTLESYTYTISIPVQTAGASVENNPTATINFGDGSGNQALSFSIVSSHYVATISHIYSSAEAYSISVNALSWAYETFGASYGSTSSTSGSVSATVYVPPSVNTLTPNSILETNPTTFTVTSMTGNYAIKNTTINWGDGTSNIITSSSTSVIAGHAYPYISSLNPNTFNANVVVCDTNAVSVCTTKAFNITGIYTTPSVIHASPSNTYATLPTSFTFNVVQGNYMVSNLQVNWDSLTSNTYPINTLTPTEQHNYSVAGDYSIQAIAIDSNGNVGNAFTQNVIVYPYIKPQISQLSYTGNIYAGNVIKFYYTATNGTFPFATTNAVTINFQTGKWASYGNTINQGTNNALFEYFSNGPFTAIETICDSYGRCGTNQTIINVGRYNWNFTSPYLVINYNVTNKTSTGQCYTTTNLSVSCFIQTNQNDILGVSYTSQIDNIANDYDCVQSITSSGLFEISCTTNPEAISYIPQTLYVTLYATDTDGVKQALTEQINLIPKSPAPPAPTAPYSTNTVARPLSSNPFVPINAYMIIAVLGLVIIFTTAFWYHLKGKLE